MDALRKSCLFPFNPLNINLIVVLDWWTGCLKTSFEKMLQQRDIGDCMDKTKHKKM